MHRYEVTQFIHAPLAEVWEFMASPKNLKRITPEYMTFRIDDPSVAEKMYAGQVINYTVTPLLGIPMKWTTEITHVVQDSYFVDEQRFGPYAFWHHQHILTAVDNGVEMRDIVHYKLPLGILGDWVHQLMVMKKVKEIFDFRFKAVEEIFNKKN